MRAVRPVLLSIATLLVACGGQVGGGTGSGSGSSGGGTSSGGGSSGPIVGALFVESELSSAGGLSGYFDANLQVTSGSSYSCVGVGATSIVGSCCYFAPTPPPPDPVGGSGTPATESNAGALALTDATSGASIGNFTYRGGGYTNLPASYPGAPWQPGDTLRVTATGDQIGAFSISAPALITPSVSFPPVFSRTQDLVLTWEPDESADTMAFQIGDGFGGIVACSADDSAGSVTVGVSLMAQFPSGSILEGAATRLTNRLAPVSSGQVELTSLAAQDFEAPIQ